MSSTPQGENWFQGADGRWYPPQNSTPPAAPPVPKKKIYQRVWFWLVLVFALAVAGCGVVLGGTAKVINKAVNESHSVEYSVAGDGTADITYATFSGGNLGESQENGSTLPWTKQLTAKGIFSSYTVSAQLQSGSSVTCTIKVDGKVVATNTSSGEFAIATCSGAGSGTP